MSSDSDSLRKTVADWCFFCELKMTPTPFSAWKKHFSLDKVWLFGGLAVVVPLLAKEISPSGIVTLSCFVDLKTMGDRCWETWEKPRRLFFVGERYGPLLLWSHQCRSLQSKCPKLGPQKHRNHLFSLKLNITFSPLKINGWKMVGRWHFLISVANLPVIFQGRAWVHGVFFGDGSQVASVSRSITSGNWPQEMPMKIGPNAPKRKRKKGFQASIFFRCFCTLAVSFKEGICDLQLM